MSEIEVGGIKIKASKWLIIILPLISTAAGGLWYGFTLWQEFLNLKATVESYQPPDLSGYEEQLGVFEERIDGLETAIETRVAALEDSLTIKIDSSYELIEKSEETLRDVKTTMRNEINTMQDIITEQDTRNRNVENNVRSIIRSFESDQRNTADHNSDRFQSQTNRLTEAFDKRIELNDIKMKEIEERIMRVLKNPLTGK